MDNVYTTIEQSLAKMLELMDFPTEISVKEEIDSNSNQSTFVCTIKTSQDHSRFLIGQHGANLYALEHLLRSILHKNNQGVHVHLDINGYKKDKDNTIKNMAKDAANSAYQEKKPIVLRPMNAYERRIVHMTIAQDERVETESIGEQSERKVIVKPKSIMNSL